MVVSSVCLTNHLLSGSLRRCRSGGNIIMVTKSDTGRLRKKKCKLGSRCTGKMFSGAFIDGKRPRGACDGSGRRLFLFLGTWTRQRRCARSAQRREGGSCERGAIGLEEMRINHTSLCTGRKERKKERREGVEALYGYSPVRCFSTCASCVYNE